MPLVRLRETSLYYHEVGEGEPLFVLHGGPGADHSYLRSFETLASEAKLIFIDQRGHGRSDRLASEWITFDGLCRDIDDLADALGLERFGIIGQSFGGYVALEYALRCTDRLTRLLLVDTGARRLTEDESRDQIVHVLARCPELETVIHEPWADDDDTVSDQVARLAPLFFYRYDALRLEAHYKDVLWRAAALQVGERLLTEWDVRSRLASISVPTLVLAGRHDIIVPCGLGRELAALVEGARFEILENSGHNAFIEEPSTFFGMVRAWLRETAPNERPS